ncbi:glutathione S-transferase N-terminal domain-containing protein [Rhodanobacter sp. C03]|uniref:glutathione S-transferase N-terminal domain-containing protein n=1 Tax=Rhodanobacter sp. C03 TaxID=1945858 RepID=UPI000985289E|nr:glutathione S-transferase N-terminal domain-containing protein [Rhodanobacter sp. C03]OOG56630.1 glutathione S-transferase [Rhodanobacter sp. C03]
MKLYYMPGVCSLADHIVLEWIGQPYQIEEVPRTELRSPEYLKLNPDGVVPVLVDDDGWVLTENIAILHYLADRFPAAGLDGDGTPRSRAEVNRWLGFLNSDVHPAFKPLFRPERFIADTARHAELQDTARAKLRSYFERLDNQLANRDWLTGTRSIADPYLFVAQRWAKAKAVDLGGLDQLERFALRMRADAGVKAAMQAEGI